MCGSPPFAPLGAFDTLARFDLGGRAAIASDSHPAPLQDLLADSLGHVSACPDPPQAQLGQFCPRRQHRARELGVGSAIAAPVRDRHERAEDHALNCRRR